jgi:hypothetical protein
VLYPLGIKAPEPPPVTSSRRGIRLRHAKGGAQSFFEVEHPGELERVKPELTPAEFDAGIMLRLLWARGTMNPEATSPSTSRLGMPRAAFTDDHDDDKRCEAQDELRAACRAMGLLGMAARYAIEVCCYERRVTSQTGCTRCAARCHAWPSTSGALHDGRRSAQREPSATRGTRRRAPVARVEQVA